MLRTRIIGCAAGLLLAGNGVLATEARAPGEGPAGTDPAPHLTVSRQPEGETVLSGALPRGTDGDALARTFPGVDADGVARTARGDPDRWARAVEALDIALPRMRRVEARLAGEHVTVEGTLRPGFAIKETRAALRAALGPGWTLDFAAEEARPPAAIDFALSDAGLSVTGILPSGISVGQALTTLGGTAAGALDAGGRGDTALWTRAIAALGSLMDAFERASGRLGPERLAVEGRLAPGHEPAALADWMRERLGGDREVEIRAEAREAAPGATRENPVTGATERLADGHWLPVLDFAPRKEPCARETALTQADEKIRFVTGSAEIELEAGRILDRLAAVARRCFARTPLLLAVSGHTDAVGGDARNRALSHARAGAVRAALAERGADPGRIIAFGYGASRPVASNETPEGRARNRRISFRWIRPVRPGRSP